ncbi:hypothetical protein B0H14DRAFT_2188627, partial [Mycena olivaceomarginata]
LVTNEAPVEVEIPVIQAIITDRRLRVDALIARIDILRATRDRLITERDEMAEHARQCTAVLWPVRRLPPELIYEIFARTLPCTRRVGHETVDQAPWDLGHISRLWR